MSSQAIVTGSRPSSARVYRPRRPAKTLRHQSTRENLETYLANQEPVDNFAGHVTLQVEIDFDQVAHVQEWPDMDQTAGSGDDIWN